VSHRGVETATPGAAMVAAAPHLVISSPSRSTTGLATLILRAGAAAPLALPAVRGWAARKICAGAGTAGWESRKPWGPAPCSTAYLSLTEHGTPPKGAAGSPQRPGPRATPPHSSTRLCCWSSQAP
jgi:hypothetical protein